MSVRLFVLSLSLPLFALCFPTLSPTADLEHSLIVRRGSSAVQPLLLSSSRPPVRADPSAGPSSRDLPGPASACKMLAQVLKPTTKATGTNIFRCQSCQTTTNLLYPLWFSAKTFPTLRVASNWRQRSLHRLGGSRRGSGWSQRSDEATIPQTSCSTGARGVHPAWRS